MSEEKLQMGVGWGVCDKMFISLGQSRGIDLTQALERSTWHRWYYLSMIHPGCLKPVPCPRQEP